MPHTSVRPLDVYCLCTRHNRLNNLLLNFLQVAKDSVSAGLTIAVSARERLNVNISTKFVGLALDLLNTFTTQGEAILSSARGSYAPYRIRNQTGSPIHVWADSDGSNDTSSLNATKIENGHAVDWRFDDWKTMREVQFRRFFFGSTLIASYSILHQRAEVTLGYNLLANPGIICAVYLSTGRANTCSHFVPGWRSSWTEFCARSRSKTT
jgi:hypothetical protein